MNPVEETDATLRFLSHNLDIPVQTVLEAIRQSYYWALGRADDNVFVSAHVAAVEKLFGAIEHATASPS